MIVAQVAVKQRILRISFGEQLGPAKIVPPDAELEAEQQLKDILPDDWVGR